MTRFTHLTPDATPVILVNDNYGATSHQGVQMALIQTRTGLRQEVPLGVLRPLGSAEAQEILAEVIGQDDTAAEAVLPEDRATMARWAQCVEAARAALQDATAEVLAMSGQDGPGWAARRRLEKALVDAGERLASFRP